MGHVSTSQGLHTMESIQLANYHAWFHHSGADGYITLAKKTANGFRQYHYKPDQLAASLSEWLGEDVYFSQNTFYKPVRNIANVRQLRALYVDIDCYLLNYDPKWVLGKIQMELLDESIIPDPNLIIFSGRGIVCVWFLDPVPVKALPLWQSVQNFLCTQLESMGGDSQALDAARVFRIAGSVNSKSGETVHVQYRHDYRYGLRDIQKEYLPALDPKRKKGRPAKIAQLHNIHRLHYARMTDLIKLVQYRNYEITGHREVVLFLYRYWLCCFLEDPDEAVKQTLAFNAELKQPLPDQEAIRATKSAEKAWQAKSDKKANEEAMKRGYPGAGYNVSNKKIIEWLGITDEEQRQLTTIIDGHEKRHRKMLANRTLRGSIPRDEYLAQQNDITEDKLFLLQKALKRYPSATQAELAAKLDVGQQYVSWLLKKI